MTPPLSERLLGAIHELVPVGLLDWAFYAFALFLVVVIIREWRR